MSVKAWYDAEDMIADAVLHVHMVRSRYDPQKARETTWVQHVTDNFCMGKLSHHRARKYSDAETIELTDEVSRHCRSSHSTELREAKDAVERVIAEASHPVRDFLDKLFNGGRITDVPAYDLRCVAERCGARLRDFELVYRRVAG